MHFLKFLLTVESTNDKFHKHISFCSSKKLVMIFFVFGLKKNIYSYSHSNSIIPINTGTN